MKEQKIKCLKCGYEWIPRKEPSQVKECPACKSRHWTKKQEIRANADNAKIQG